MPKVIDIPPMLGSGRYDLDTVDSMQPDSVNKWWVLRTFGNGEKELARALERRQLAYYLPLIGRRGASNEVVQSSLFSGYMFLFGTVQHRYDALRTNKIVQVCEVVDQSTLHWELVGVSRVIESGLELRVLSRLSKGDECEVTNGPLIGLKGVVDSLSGDELWVSLWITYFGQSVLFKIARVKLKLATECWAA